ncbi:Nucleotidylyl transferase [Auricularia subglabra TFB-10046 SS5]|uniref:Nucleotidylyl transferase n=1 Tax=Auricularia subglabra (strain TFB-10046 / SS5) TaxID=717982 RepID=J0WKX1_AURST|nr:Nucleotidylyl transferase [Auricularia subglabra TFB-10046 SS5]
MALFRSAPLPTGSQHLGALHAVLFKLLLSQNQGREWLLRIEDIDAVRPLRQQMLSCSCSAKSRYVPGSVEELAREIDWTGLTRDYGHSQCGSHGPYHQVPDALDLYKSYADKLLERCHPSNTFCSPNRLADMRTWLPKLGRNATCCRRCPNLTDEEGTRRVRAVEKHLVRFLVRASSVPTPTPVLDPVFGLVKNVHTSLPTDTVLLKTDMFPTFHLASVFGDHDMGL